MGIFTDLFSSKNTQQHTLVEFEALKSLRSFKQYIDSFMVTEFATNQDNPSELNSQIKSFQQFLDELKKHLSQLGFKDVKYLTLPNILFSKNNITTQAKTLDSNLNHLSNQIQLIITDIENHPGTVGIDREQNSQNLSNNSSSQ